jgi:uncharacterized protein with FMN-binding domain
VVTPMRRRVTAVMTVTTAVVVALSLRASAQGHADPSAVAPAGVVTAAPSTTTPRPPTTLPVPTTSKAPRVAPTHRARRPASRTPTPTASSITVNGGVADTMYGPVQVQVTVRGGRITGAHAIVYPQGGGRDQQINGQAVPQLDQETLQIQSARIDTVSGATYTSDGYRRSLQSALDAAHRSA